MKIFIISDTHFGVRNCSPEWLKIQMDSMDWFVGRVRELSSISDRVVHLGDVFDSRQSIHMKALNAAPQKFRDLSSIVPIDIILGNHDCHDKNTNDINSVEPTFGTIPNVTIMREPKVVDIGGRSIGFMPWRYGDESDRAAIEKATMESLRRDGAEILMCHTDMRGANFNPWQKIDGGCASVDFAGFRMVFSGHIHHRQTLSNVTFVGPPYSMTRSDVGNSKGFHVLDTETMKVKFYENPVCPKFLKVAAKDIINMKLADFKRLVDNNFVDVIVDFHSSPDFPYQELARLVEGRARGLHPVGERKAVEAPIESEQTEEGSSMDVLQLGSMFIDSMRYDQKIKTKLNKALEELYKRAMSQKGA